MRLALFRAAALFRARKPAATVAAAEAFCGAVTVAAAAAAAQACRTGDVAVACPALFRAPQQPRKPSSAPRRGCDARVPSQWPRATVFRAAALFRAAAFAAALSAPAHAAVAATEGVTPVCRHSGRAPQSHRANKNLLQWSVSCSSA